MQTDKPKTTTKDFFLWAGAMIALYGSVAAFISLLFEYVNRAFPDALRYYTPSFSDVSYEMATLIVLFPIFIVLMRIIRKDIMRDSSRSDIWVRRWALGLTLFVAGVTLAGDLITLLMYFFNGDVTGRFLLKVLIVFLVAGGAFLHYLADLRGYYERNPQKSLLMLWATSIMVAVAILVGFLIIGTPWEARLYRYDDQKVMDLQNIQLQIVNYWQQKEAFPASLEDLNDPISGFVAPRDPQTGAGYEYRVTAGLSFELCATFNMPAQASQAMGAYPELRGHMGMSSWQHEAGRTCFSRTIDPDLYPPLKKG